MALTRKMLKAMGIEEEKIDQIIDAHTETVDGIKADRDSFKEDAEKLRTVQKELDELKAAAEKSDKDPFKVKYEALKEEYAQYKQEVETKELNAKKEAAYRALLKDVGVSEKRLDAVLRVTDLSQLKLDENGSIEDSAELKKTVKAEWADFIVTTSQKGADTATPPDGNGKVYKSKEEIMAIKDAGERQKAIAENHELFGF